MNAFLLYSFLILFYSSSRCYSIDDEQIKSKAAAKNHNSILRLRRCPHTLKKLWHVEISSFPFSAPPLVTDVDGDGGLDIVVAPFGETITVIEGETGKHLHSSSWPQQNLDRSVYSSPLQFDIDGNGVQDILIVTSSGEGLFYSKNGIPLVNFSFAIPPVYVKADWYEGVKSVNHMTVSQYVSLDQRPDHIPVDPHVLSTPVLQGMRYLVIPVSFYFNGEDYTFGTTPFFPPIDFSDPNSARPWGSDDVRDKFYVTAVATLDLLEFQSIILKKSKKDQNSPFLKIHFLDLHQTPVFGLFTPTVIYLETDATEPQIIHSSTSGSLYVLGMTSGTHRQGFPQTLGSVSGRVSTVDIDGDGILELLVPMTSGEVSCLDSKTSQIKWTVRIGSSSVTGSRVADVDLDGHLDIVLVTEVGDVFALHGNNGSVMPNYPYKGDSPIHGNVLVTKLNKNRRGPLDLIFLSEDGELHILASDHSCLSKVPLGDSALVDILSDDLVLMNHGLELLVATADGSLICLGTGVESTPEELVDKSMRLARRRFVYPQNALSQNDFVSLPSKPDIFIEDTTRNLKEVTGNSFYLKYSLHNLLPKHRYSLRIYLGNSLVHGIERELPSSLPDWLTISTPDQPGEGLVTVVLSDAHGISCSDSVYLKFNQLILLDLQWLVVTPFIAMAVILLVNHGFPAKDLLPVTFPFKAK